MEQEIEEQIVNKNPDVFKYYMHPPETGPKPQISLFGFECDSGWADLISHLATTISNQGVPIYATQVKEKYGQLRFYYTVGVEDLDSTEEQTEYTQQQQNRLQMINGMTLLAQELSYTICEKCGSWEAELRKPNKKRIKTLCDDCFDVYKHE